MTKPILTIGEISEFLFDCESQAVSQNYREVVSHRPELRRPRWRAPLPRGARMV